MGVGAYAGQKLGQLEEWENKKMAEITEAKNQANDSRKKRASPHPSVSFLPAPDRALTLPPSLPPSVRHSARGPVAGARNHVLKKEALKK